MLRRGPRAVLALACLGAALLAAVGVACAPSPPLSSPRVTPPSEPTLSAAIEPTLSAATEPTLSAATEPTLSAATEAASALTPLPSASPTPAASARQTDDPTAVVVFAASSFGQALSELGSDFMLAVPEATGVTYHFGKSDTLRAMIEQGAQADVFISQDAAPVDSLRQENLLDGAPDVLTTDQLVIVVSRANPQHLQSLKDLATSGVRFIVPAPSSATTTALLAAFDAASRDPTYGDDFRARADRNVLARDGDDQQVITRIVDGEVSAGVVYASSLGDPASRAQVQTIAVPDSVSAPLEYPIAVLKNATNRRGGQAFVHYALSGRAQDILSRYGFVGKGSGTTHAPR
jgi:molybdate transport system substrate-binding protein